MIRPDNLQERIEKKLGCSIEEYFEKRLRLAEEFEGCEIETPNPLVELDWDELDYIGEYLQNKTA